MDVSRAHPTPIARCFLCFSSENNSAHHKSRYFKSKQSIVSGGRLTHSAIHSVNHVSDVRLVDFLSVSTLNTPLWVAFARAYGWDFSSEASGECAPVIAYAVCIEISKHPTWSLLLLGACLFVQLLWHALACTCKVKSKFQYRIWRLYRSTCERQSWNCVGSGGMDSLPATSLLARPHSYPRENGLRRSKLFIRKLNFLCETPGLESYFCNSHVGSE